MTALRKQFVESLQAQGMSPHTQEEYVRVVRQLAQFYHRSPDLITDQEIQQFLRHLKQNKGLSESTIFSVLWGLKAFYTQILKRDWSVHFIEHCRTDLMGFLHPNAKKRFNALKEQLEAQAPDPPASPPPQDPPQTDTSSPNKHTPQDPGVCPYCGSPLRYLGRLPRSPRGPPCEE